MSSELKQRLHKLIDECENETLLNEAKDVLESPDLKDWWDDLSEDEQNVLMESEEQYGKGEYISHNSLMQQFETWKKK